MIGCDCDVCRSPDPRDQRLRSSIYIETPECSWVVDTGTDFRTQALRENIHNVDAVIFTHSHTDHIMGFDDLRRFSHARGSMPVYASAETMRDLERVFQFAFNPSNAVPYYLKPEPHIIDGPFKLGETLITPLPVPHGDSIVNGYLFSRACARLRNTDLQSVRPTEFHSGESKTPDRMPGGHTGQEACVPRIDKMTVFRGFDEHADIQRTRRNLPHWEQEGATYFVTFRLVDAVPQQLAHQWREELETWRKFHPEPWDSQTVYEYRSRFFDQREEWLDQGHGSCVLRRLDAAKIVRSVLEHFRGERYHLDAFIVMPNHVHALVQPLPGYSLANILGSWKSFTARSINRLLGRTGTLWMEESFDRIVRDFDELRRYRDYIARNPEKAKLRESEFILSTRGTLQPAWNTDLQSVRPTEFYSGESKTPDKMSGGRTGQEACVPDAYEKLVAYLSDCSAVPDTIVDLIAGVKVLIIDALRDRPHPTHLSVGQALEVAALVKPAATYFTHICHDLPQSAESRLPKGVRIAYDGLKLTF